MGFLLAKLFSKLVLPPGSIILLGFAGLLARRRFPRVGLGLMTLSIFAFYLLSTPIVSRALVLGLEVHDAVAPEELTGRVEAIVVLGGGIYVDAREYAKSTVSMWTLARLRYGAYLHRRTGLPLLVTGGTQERTALEGHLMAEVLREDFAVPVRWVDARARNTEENAVYSAAILKRAGVTRVAVVTHASHMPRAVRAFEKQGLQVVAAPTHFVAPVEMKQASGIFFPQGFALNISTVALHEYIGRLWYWMRY